MTFCAYEGSLLQCALWNRKSIVVPKEERRVLVIHGDWSIGDSVFLLLGTRGFSAFLATEIFAARGTIAVWDPHAILLDTRVGGAKNYDFASELSDSERPTLRLLIAMSNFSPEDSVDHLKRAGYDGHTRRPCPIWEIADLLGGFFDNKL
jgi:DNA-binding response OmpR family regulator